MSSGVMYKSELLRDLALMKFEECSGTLVSHYPNGHGKLVIRGDVLEEWETVSVGTYVLVAKLELSLLWERTLL